MGEGGDCRLPIANCRLIGGWGSFDWHPTIGISPSALAYATGSVLRGWAYHGGMSKETRDNSPSTGGLVRWWVLAAVLAGLCLIVRSGGLLALPIFGDEAIYLRWAQMIRPGGGGQWWVSLCDPKPPLHFWLIAAVWGLARDPLRVARMVSVMAGVASVPAVMGVCAELGQLVRAKGGGDGGLVSGRAVGMLAGVMVIFCPFLAFYQRLATADALFVLEMVVAVWVALWWARRVVDGRGAWPGAAGAGRGDGAGAADAAGIELYVVGDAGGGAGGAWDEEAA